MAGVLADSSRELEKQGQDQEALLQKKKEMTDYSWLPSWAYDDWVVPIAQERVQKATTAGEYRLTMFDVAGPATKTAMTGFFVQLVYLLVFQVLIWKTSHCESSETGTTGKQFVQNPTWLYATYFPVFCFVTWCEWKCFRDMSIPLIQWCGPLKIMGCRFPFFVYFIYELCLSTMASSSRPSQSLFIIQTFRTFQCEGGDDLFDFWRKGERFLPTDRIFGLESLVIVVMAAWILMFVEAVYAMVYTIPIEKVEYGPRSMQAGYEVIMSLNPLQIVSFSKKAGDGPQKTRFHIWHADAVQYLAGPAAMHSLQAHYMEYSLQRAQVAAELDPAKEMRAFQIIGMEATRVVSRFGFQCIQMSCALEVHVTLIMFDASRVGGAEHLCPYRIIAPMILHILSAMLQLGDALGRTWTLFHFRGKINKVFAGSLGDEDAARADHNSTRITAALASLIFGIALYSAVLADVLMKFKPILVQVPIPTEPPDFLH